MRKVIKQVIAVDVDDLKYLTNGEIYDVVAIPDDENYIVINDKDKEHEYYQHRFEDVEDEGNVVDSSERAIAPNNPVSFGCRKTITIQMDVPVDKLAKLQELLED
jgi:signal peptidase I